MSFSAALKAVVINLVLKKAYGKSLSILKPLAKINVNDTHQHQDCIAKSIIVFLYS